MGYYKLYLWFRPWRLHYIDRIKEYRELSMTPEQHEKQRRDAKNALLKLAAMNALAISLGGPYEYY